MIIGGYATANALFRTACNVGMRIQLGEYNPYHKCNGTKYAVFLHEFMQSS